MAVKQRDGSRRQAARFRTVIALVVVIVVLQKPDVVSAWNFVISRDTTRHNGRGNVLGDLNALRKGFGRFPAGVLL